jgi:intracellular sulfur oxidation DsrE/DsrF family protein
MKKLVLYLLAAAVLFGLAAAMLAQKSKKHRVVIDVTMAGPDAWAPVLNGIENVQKVFGAENVEIEAVAHEKGLGMVVKASDPGLAERMQRIAATGVVFAACENSMRHQNVSKGDLFPFDITVDSGAAELIRKQEAGWAYIEGGS